MKRMLFFVFALMIVLSVSVPSFAGIIHVAANNGNFEKVKRLVSNNPDLVNEKDLNNKTALHFAAFAGHPEIVEYLLENGADVNAKDVYNMTPLHAAVLRSLSPSLNSDSVKKWNKLIDRLNAHATAEEKQVWDNLDETVRNTIAIIAKTHSSDSKDREMIINGLNTLLAKRDFYSKEKFPAIKLNEDQEYQIKDGFDCLSKNNLMKFNRTVLESIIPEISKMEDISGNFKVVEILLSRGANINGKGKEGVTALHLAILYDNDRIAQLLIEKGAGFDIRTDSSYTALYYAYMKRNLRIIKMLEDRGADTY